MMTMDDIRRLSREAFIRDVGHVFEHSPWVAESAYDQGGPFLSTDDVYRRMLTAMHAGSEEQKLSLLRAHPDLGGRIQMTEASVAEQKGAGLDQLSAEEYQTLQELNTLYTEKFGFPFILAVKGKTKEEIITNLKERIHHTKEKEFATALHEVGKIAGFRLHDLITGMKTKEEISHD
ncbi:2-oxo-4-hydroxy-4-carboxy-5-ureidoimidazoline decarboxylase [Salisediminibacterium beveridgei]|nr:2-oxo-4-hydroxy-4-carboxy-5-ureidoimidazoline decarboxylase [Salisediminibacterium beveridgei]